MTDNENMEQEEQVEEPVEEQVEEQEKSTEEIEPKEESKDDIDIANMSDEEFMKFLDEGGFDDTEENDKEEKEESKEESEEPVLDENPKKERQVKKENKKDDESYRQKKIDDKPASPSIDYEAVYKNIFRPFRANGKEITPKTPQDVISLMQMGANYTKKMQLLAPARKMVESLNNANISEGDLAFLIDVYKGNKQAIKHLLKSKNIDPINDIDLDEEDTYRPDARNIATDDDVEFSDTLLDINDAIPEINRIMNDVWDKKSKSMLLKDPNLLRALAEEVQMGRFEQVQKLVDEEKTFGKYQNVPDVEAYIDVVTKLVNEERAKAAAFVDKNVNRPESTSTLKQNKPNSKSKAAPTRSKSSKTGSSLTVKDIFSMSDEDFLKLSESDLY